MRKLSVFLILLLLPATAQAPPDRLAETQKKLKKTDAATTCELIEQADKDPDPRIRRAILDRVGRLHLPGVREFLERHAAGDPDAGVALVALERLRILQAQDLAQLFDKRLALAKSQKDDKALETLTPAHQRWVTHARGATLPAFLQQPPAVFEAIPSKPSVRVVAIGDFGREGPNQTNVAAAVAAWHRRNTVDFGLTLGDNFEPDGVTGPADRRWQGGWEKIYDPPRIPFFAATGNHDWGFADSPAAEILYARQSPTWRMPALYYSFTAGPVQFFALATQAWSETQRKWLDQELQRSTARWKIVYGHHPIYSYGVHGDTPELQQSLLPVLKNRAQIYLVGHDHLVQHLKPEGGVHFFVVPAAGQSARAVETGPLTLFADSFYGFAVFDINERQLKVSFVDTEGKVRYETDLGK
jgi:tartrate-resistant acid phosphatase type 5